MKDINKQGLLALSITVVKILLLVVLFVNAFVFIFYGLIDRGDEIKRESVRILEDQTIRDREDGSQTIDLILPQDIKDNEYLFFDTRKDVAVYINGELRKDFIEKRDVNIPGGSFKRFILTVPLKDTDSGAEVNVIRYSFQDIDRGAPEIMIGTRSGLISYLGRTIGLLFILSFIVLIFSFVSFVVSIVLRLMYKQRIDMMYGALGIFIISAWLLTDSNLFPFILGTYHVNGILSFMLCLSIPLGLIIYLSSILRGRYKKSMLIVIFVAILNVLVWPLMHYSGIINFYNAIDIANGVLVFLAVAGIAILAVDAIKGHTVSYRYTFIGFMGFLVGCLIELTNTLLDMKIVRESIPMVVGLGFLLTFIVIQQVHDLRKINMEKQHAIDISEAKTRFLASMSHEIRTPINAILGMNEMILRENRDKEIEEYSRNIKTSGNMLLMLVNDVLDFTRIEAGKLEINEAGFLMSDMLYDVVSLIKERAEEKTLELKTEITDEVPNEMISDEFRIRQILVNLMNNAVKYTERGTITLKVGGSYTDDGYELCFHVLDTGKGIRKEEQAHLFEAFSRADIKSNASIEGTGLGLAIVKSIVSSMNGNVGVESTYGEGSDFWVKLPAGYKPSEALKSDFMERRTERTTISRDSSFRAPEAKILAVDDNQSNLTIVKLFLKKNGIKPDLCSTGKKAIELCREKRYDLILLDHMMPEPDGIETLHIIREDAASLNKDTKAIVLTANAVAGSRQMYMNEGFDDYITKPLDSDVLEETVKNSLPKEKVIEASSVHSSVEEKEEVTEEVKEEAKEKTAEESSSIKSRLTTIEGLDYDTALDYCGGEEELLQEIISDIAGECSVRTERMRKSLEANDIKAYRIDAHSIKGSMATIGLKDFSERAKKHEFAAKDNDLDFINGDIDDFISEYTELCEKLKNI